MALPKVILVVHSATDTESHALKRAVLLAQKSKAKLVFASVVYDESYDMTTILTEDKREALKKLMLEEREKSLQEIAKTQIPQDLETKIEVTWNYKLASGVDEIAKGVSADLIVKAVKHESALSKIFFTPEDWHLLREAHCDILLVKKKDWVPGGNMLSALCAYEPDDPHKRLNQRILEQGDAYSETFDATLHAVNVYPRPLVDVPLGYSGIDYNAYCEDIKHAHEVAMDTLIKDTKIDSKHSHVKEGLPEQEVAELSEEINAELIILGTVARAGLGGAVLGNTAERILDKIQCDILALRLN